MSAAADRTYGERIRHPSGALGGQEENRSKLWLWILLGIGALIFAWRMGWLDKIIAAAKAGVNAARPISNPHGWV